MQAIGRWGNFFNQELYGPPTTCPGASRSTVPTASRQYPCTMYPPATTGFHPLFLYESRQRHPGRDHADLDRASLGPADAAGRPVPDLASSGTPTVRFAARDPARRATGRPAACPTATIISVLVIVGSPRRPGCPAPARCRGRRPLGRSAGSRPGRRVRRRSTRLEVPADAAASRRRRRRRPTTAPTWSTTRPSRRRRRRPPGRWGLTTSPPRRCGGRARDPRADARAARPPSAALSPDPGRARGRPPGGAREGLEWLGRTPGVEGVARCTGSCAWSPGSSCFGVFRFRIQTSGQEHLPARRLPAHRRGASRLDGPVRRHARAPGRSRAPGSWAAARRPSPRARASA